MGVIYEEDTGDEYFKVVKSREIVKIIIAKEYCWDHIDFCDTVESRWVLTKEEAIKMAKAILKAFEEND